MKLLADSHKLFPISYELRPISLTATSYELKAALPPSNHSVEFFLLAGQKIMKLLDSLHDSE